MRFIKLLFITAILLNISCEKWKVEGKLLHNKKLADDLRSSPEVLTIGNSSLKGAAFLYRDFMPGTYEDGSSLYSIVKVFEKDSLIIPDNISLIKQYVIKEDEVWEPDFRAEISNSYYLSNSSEGGPYWGPNETVDVVIELEDEIAGKVYRILVSSQEIGAVQ